MSLHSIPVALLWAFLISAMLPSEGLLAVVVAMRVLHLMAYEQAEHWELAMRQAAKGGLVLEPCQQENALAQVLTLQARLAFVAMALPPQKIELMMGPSFYLPEI